MINLLLFVVKNVDRPLVSDRVPSVPWGTLFTELVLDEWEMMPRSVVDNRIEIIQALFAHGASPNAPWVYTTMWLWLCGQLRLMASPMNPVRADAVSKCVEILVSAGADLGGKGSITPSEVAALFPARLAGRIVEAMAQHSKATQPQSLGTMAIAWARWTVSWAWGGT
jgi:hypothetical protein